jgi:hypothetical protein
VQGPELDPQHCKNSLKIKELRYVVNERRDQGISSGTWKI